MLLFLAAFFLAIATILGFKCISYIQNESTSKPLKSKAKTIKKKKQADPFIVGIGGIVAFSAIVTVLVDYQFKIMASSAYPDSSDLVSFLEHSMAYQAQCPSLCSFLSPVQFYRDSVS